MHLFGKNADFEACQRVMIQAHQRHPIRILSYCVMSKPWHFVVWPETDGQVTAFFRMERPVGEESWGRCDQGHPLALAGGTPVDWTDRVNAPLSAKER